MRTRARTFLTVAALCLAPASGGAAQTPPPARLSFAAPGSLSLPELLDLAARHNPDLAVVRAQAEAARGKLVQAGLWLNPLLSVRSDTIGDNRNALGVPALTIQQEFVTGGKLRLAREAAARGVAAADWNAVTRWYDVSTRVRLAYAEALAARLEVRAQRELVGIAAQGLGVAEKLEKAGAGSRPDVLRARVELEQTRIRLRVSERRAEAAWRLLAVAVGLPELPGSVLEGDLEAPAPDFDWPSLVQTVLTRSSEVQAAQALHLQAEQLLARARAEVVPNLYLKVRPMYSAPERDTSVLVEAGAAVPLFNRNQGNIAAAQADVVRAQAEIRQTELRLTERLTTAFQRYQAARLQAAAYEKEILPSARESLRLVTLGYERGDPKFDYTAVLQAQGVLSQARLLYVQALGELWRAVSDLGGLLQVDDLPIGTVGR